MSKGHEKMAEQIGTFWEGFRIPTKAATASELFYTYTSTLVSNVLIPGRYCHESKNSLSMGIEAASFYCRLQFVKPKIALIYIS